MTDSASTDFFACATHAKILDAEQAKRIARDASELDEPPVQFALSRRRISPADADILETLMNPDESIPGYQILGILGRGGMGVIYRARQTSLQREVALKTILLSELATETAAIRFEQEARSVARLTHPNIIAAYDFGSQAGRLYFAMELVRGEDADRLVQRRGALPESLVWHIIRQAAAGLAHATALGMVHRDIKPANLMLVTPPAGFPLPSGIPLVKVADFGLAILSTQSPAISEIRLTKTNAVLGSPVYMAPEQLEHSQADHRTDLYALGATAWHLLVGRPPFADKNLSQLIAAKLSQPLEAVDRHRPLIHPLSVRLVADMVARKPEDRISDYGKLLQRIDTLLPLLSEQHHVGESLVSSWNEQAAANRTESSGEVTIEATRVIPARVQGRRVRMRWALVGLLLFAICGWLGWSYLSEGAVAPERLLRPMGAPVALFDGRSIAGWRTMSGEWQSGNDEEGAAVLKGTNGIMARAIPLPLTAIEAYRIEALVSLQSATGVELRFAVPRDAAINPSYFAIRITKEIVEVRELQRNGSLEKTLVTFKTTSILPNMTESKPWISLMVEKQAEHWWVLVENKPLCTIPQHHFEASADFQLVVEGGTAYFAELAASPLGNPSGDQLPWRPHDE